MTEVDVKRLLLELDEGNRAVALLVVDEKLFVRRLRVEDITEYRDESQPYYCSHAVEVNGDEVLCGNTFGTPQKVSNVNDCQHCSVGMVRRLRDGW